jgi:Short C-terminal domain
MLLRPFVRNGRPGLIGTMARTTIVVGTGTAAAGGVSRRQQAKALPATDARAGRQEAAGAPATPTDTIAQLKELAALKERGILTEEEFAAQKARVLGA